MGLQSMMYYAAATLVGIAVILLLGQMLRRSQETSVDSTQILRAKNGLFAAIQNIELDFRNVGGGKRDVTTTFPGSAIDTAACGASIGAECRFRFYARVDSTTTDSSLVEYFWTQSSSEVIDTDLSGSVDDLVSTPTYTLRRVVDGTQRFAIDRVRRFRVGVFDENEVPTTDAVAIREIEVELSVLVPTTQMDDQQEEVSWRSVFRPVNLTRTR